MFLRARKAGVSPEDPKVSACKAPCLPACCYRNSSPNGQSLAKETAGLGQGNDPEGVSDDILDSHSLRKYRHSCLAGKRQYMLIYIYTSFNAQCSSSQQRICRHTASAVLRQREPEPRAGNNFMINNLETTETSKKTLGGSKSSLNVTC